MRQLLSHLDRICDRVFNRSYGWTGVEIGCHAIHMAQVRRIDHSWQLAAVWSVEHPSHCSTESTESSSQDDETFGWLPSESICEKGLDTTLEYLRDLNTLFKGNYCAATLNDGMIDYREMELPQCNPSESLSMVHSEIALESESEMEQLIAGCWQLPNNRPNAITASFGAVSVKRSTAQRIANDLLAVGFECQTLDAVPCAMARATAMVTDDKQVATLAVDIGYKQATITLVHNGQPILSRGIRNLGLLPLIEQIATSFEITLSDSKTLLFQATAGRSVPTDDQDQFTNPLQQVLNQYMHILALEIDKTIEYANRAYRTITASQLLLMGDGCRIPSVQCELASRVGLLTQIWSIDLSSNLFGEQQIASFAIAAGLSALAWEDA
jgi:Tfp pilus assembly PilM family ATPase